jgi:hypothetical protein
VIKWPNVKQIVVFVTDGKQYQQDEALYWARQAIDFKKYLQVAFHFSDIQAFKADG